VYSSTRFWRLDIEAELDRAVDRHGRVIDVLLSARSDLAGARRLFIRALRAGPIPAEVTTDRAAACPRVPGELIPAATAHSRAGPEQSG
jgi:transposase-like protein